MPRALLLSLLVVGFVCGFVGRATYASFSANPVAEGDAAAGTLTINTEDDELVFNQAFPITTDCPGAMDVGSTCYLTMEITNSGSLAGILDVTQPVLSIDGGHPYCFTSQFFAFASLLDQSAGEAEGGFSKLFPPDDVEILVVEITLENSEGVSDCYGAVVDVTVALQASQAVNPHSTADEESESE